jgi:thioredoxin-like negative regulator of GroEL
MDINFDSEFIKFVSNSKKKYIFIDFYGNFCRPCKNFKNHLFKIMKNPKYFKVIDFCKVNIINIDNVENIVNTFSVDRVPTFVVFLNNKENPFNKPTIVMNVVGMHGSNDNTYDYICNELNKKILK